MSDFLDEIEDERREFGSRLGAYVLDEKGEPVLEPDVLKWAEWMGQSERHVALTKFAWGEVSTVFLGLDHNFARIVAPDSAELKPVLWETMVFGGALDQEQRRYTSRAEALTGHAEIVQRASKSERRISIFGWRLQIRWWWW
jgi:hypothetical protein